MFLISRYIIPIIVLFAMTVSLTQCISETEIDIPYEPAKISVICHPVPNRPIYATLGYSSTVTSDSIIPNDFFPLVDIFSGSGKLFDSLRKNLDDNTNKPFWKSTEYPKADSAYSLRIINPEFPYDTITASTFIPKPMKVAVTADMDSIPPTIVAGRVIKQIPISITVDDIWKSDSLFAASIVFVRTNLAGGDTRSVPARFVAAGPTLSNLHVTPDNSILVEKKFWKGNFPRTLNLTLVVDYLEQYEEPLRISVEWRTASSEYYQYYLSLARQGNIGLPFNDPDILYNNIKGGYGNFSGYSTYNIDITL